MDQRNRQGGKRWRGLRCVALALMAASGLAQPVADVKQPEPVPELVPPMVPKRSEFKPPPLSDAVMALIDQDYLTAQERAALRVRHGVWEEEDLSDPALRARAAIIRGAIGDPALADAGAGAEDAAEGAMLIGEPAKALEILKDRPGAWAARLRAEAMLELGKTAEAVAELRAAAGRLSEGTPASADELAEGVRCALLLTRLQDPRSEGAVGHQRMLTLLATARDELDRTSWKAYLVEAQLLYEKDMYQEVGAAVEAALSLNPRCAEAYWLYGLLCVDTFDFERGGAIADKLDELAAPGLSPWGACLRAYIRLRQQEGVEAERLLGPALAAFPKSRVLLAYHAAAAASAFNFELADARLKEMDVLSPGSPEGFMQVGKTMSGARQYEEAVGYLREAARRAPHWAQPIVELGLTEFQAGNNDAAIAALETATRLDKDNKRAANSLTLLNELGTYTSVESEHFVVRCKDGIDKVVASEMLPPLEAIYTRVTGDGPGGIDHEPTHKTVVELYPNHRWFGVRITGMPALHTIAAATGPVIAMEAPREGPGHMGEFDWRRVVQHEYTHTVTLSRTKNRLPHWFTEASAVYLEDAPRDYSVVQLLARAYETDRLFDLDKINVMFARPERPSDRSQAYAQGHAMYEFIIDRFGADKPLALMDQYAKGVREAEGFQSLLGVSREEFLAQFKDWLHAKLDEWGMVPSGGAPSIRQLLEEEAAKAKELKAAEKAKAEAEKPAPPAEEKPGDAKPEDVKPEGEPEGGAKKTDEPEEEPEDDGPGGPTPELIEAWAKRYPHSPFVLSLRVQEKLRETNGVADAGMVELLEDYAAARPVDPLPHKLLAAFYLGGGDAEKGTRAAIEHLEYLDIREQRSAGYAIELARQYSAIGDLDKAAAKAARATQIAPYNPAYREFAARVALQRKDYADAERHIRALIALEPDREIHKQRLEALMKLTP